MSTTRPSLMTMLSELIAAPSMSSVSPAFDTSNMEVIELLSNWLKGDGFSVEVLPLATQPNKANLIATLGSGPGGLVLAGHTDTVPYDEHRWQFDPFQLTETEGRLHGLGTSDMKTFFALAIEAARAFEAAQLKQPLIILATADEESSMDGAKALVELGKPKARYAVIGEPTGMKPVNAHKGILMEAIHLQGHAGHSSDPSLGNNALEGMYHAIGEIIAWRNELQGDYHNPAFKVPFPTLNLGHIHGGDNPNRICGDCELHIDLRPLPGMDMEVLRNELWQRLETKLAPSGLALSIHPLFSGINGMETPRSSDIVQAAEKLTGHSAEAVSFGTEGPFLTEMGMETIILGPGDIAQAHQPDEYLALDRITPTVDLLQRLIHRFCVTSD
jgi:acetylornithine deacetylase